MGKLPCWLGWPPGHLYESVTYRDPVSGRWRAYARCLRCEHQRRLSVGDRKRPANFPGNPLATLLAWGPWRGATVYCARRLGTGRRAASRDLRAAVARASDAQERASWVEDLARQLEHELAP